MAGTILIRALTPAPRYRLRALSLFLAAYLALGQIVLPMIDPSYADALPNHDHLSLNGHLSPSHLHVHDIEALGLDRPESRPNDGSDLDAVISLSNASSAMQTFASLQASAVQSADLPWPLMHTVALAPPEVRDLSGRPLKGIDRPPSV